MKNLNILLVGLGLIALSSCNDFLDKLPDDRAEVNTFEKAKKLVASAYAEGSPAFLMEWSSDNVMDNGKTFLYQTNQSEVYRWKPVTTTENDDPRSVWNNSYLAVGHANEVLASLSKVKDRDPSPVRAEALLCRAWTMFRLSNIFCMAYDGTKADQYLGLPYPKEPGVSVNERGTLKQLYENINADIEEALPLLDDSYLTAPKYHFNSRAAYAFAARFNLYYGQWQKAIDYATKALGSTPSADLRNWAHYKTLSGSIDIHNAYISSSEKANYMLQTAYSSLGRLISSGALRFNFAQLLVEKELFWAPMPWGRGSQNNTLYQSRMLYGNTQLTFFPKIMSEIQYTNAAKTTGYVHSLDAVLTADETLLVRAEAEILLKNYTAALADMNAWVVSHTEETVGSATRPTLTEASINSFFNGLSTVPAKVMMDAQMGVKKPLHPQGFSVEDGTQTNMLYALLQMRRIETWQQGLRFQDIKRYGIEITHRIDGEDPIYFVAGDLRGAIQLPSDVINSGLQANPRN